MTGVQTCALPISGLISATGNITGGNITVTNIAGSLTTAAQGNITSVGTLTGLNSSGAISATGNVTGGNLITGAAISAGGAVSATGNVTGGNIITNGLINAGGAVSATGGKPPCEQKNQNTPPQGMIEASPAGWCHGSLFQIPPQNARTCPKSCKIIIWPKETNG